MTRRKVLASGLAAGALTPMTLAQAQSPPPPRFTALALQTRCEAVNQDQNPQDARARMAASIARVSAQIAAARGFLQGFNGYPVKLVVLPEYWMTGFPLGETRQAWQAKAAIALDGVEADALAAMAQRHGIHLCSNHYELDPHFPDLYFQANVIYGPNGDVLCRYRRMISLYTPTPYDVWDRYLDAYGLEGVWPVAVTELGVLGTIASEEILYPEIARMAALRGAEILLHPTSEVGSPQLTPKHIGKLARAVENMAYIVSANSAEILGVPVPSASTDGMSLVADWYGRILAEAGPGESLNANALLDVAGLRSARQQAGMTNTLSRLPMDAFAADYADRTLAPPNRTPDGRMMERAEVLQRQRETIARMTEEGVIRP
ncbi:MAG: nitrilase [Alphaproteobacteria bacterium]|jgi:predicted amidohydrolase|nr:nitrilase [Alphaproteobacteria bacterium]